MGCLVAPCGGFRPGGVLREEEFREGCPSIFAQVELLQLDGDSGFDPALGGQLRELPSDPVAL